MRERAAEITLSEYAPYLRYYHYIHRDGSYYLFFNESVTETVDATVTIPADGAVSMAEYDAWENRRKPAAYSRTKGR